MKLSIVIPIYNVRNYLSACVESVLLPDRSDYEIILVNDGSTDDSGVIAAEYASRFPDTVRLITTENGGLGAARNVGLEAAAGDFVFFLDSDDRLAEEALPEILAELEIPKVDGVLLDLGVSSYQLDTPERGFSYREDAPLDMRMDQRESLTAADIVNGYSEKELARLIYDYGEDPAARSIARHIAKHREKKPITTTLELADIVRESVPPKVRMTGGHPAKRTFQAIRIACNRELEVLENTLGSMIEALTPGGRIAVITFHSLEDRIVKNAFKTAENPCICPPDFPVCVCGRKSKGRVVTRKPILPSEEELAVNSRSSSAKLRIFERGEDN